MATFCRFIGNLTFFVRLLSDALGAFQGITDAHVIDSGSGVKAAFRRDVSVLALENLSGPVRAVCGLHTCEKVVCRDGCGTNLFQGVQHSAVLVFPAFGLVRLLAGLDSTDRK